MFFNFVIVSYICKKKKKKEDIFEVTKSIERILLYVFFHKVFFK